MPVGLTGVTRSSLAGDILKLIGIICREVSCATVFRETLSPIGERSFHRPGGIAELFVH